jgi:hypothetical protein
MFKIRSSSFFLSVEAVEDAVEVGRAVPFLHEDDELHSKAQNRTLKKI